VRSRGSRVSRSASSGGTRRYATSMTDSPWRRLRRRLRPLRRRLRPGRQGDRRRSRAKGTRVPPETTPRHDFLSSLHSQLRPRTYLEIGVNDGRSLARSHVPSIAIDPAFKVTVEIRADVHLVRATSDDFFARPDPLAHFRDRDLPAVGMDPNGPPAIDLAFIDGMHLFEFALRDFMNVERYTNPASVIVFDDMLPRSVEEAARSRVTGAWAGDVYKLIAVLRRYRPDLILLPIDVQKTGLAVVLAPDSTSTVLRDAYDEIVAANMIDDPQPVPNSILQRDGAVALNVLEACGIWNAIADARARRAGRDEVVDVVLRELGSVVAEGVRAMSPGDPDQQD